MARIKINGRIEYAGRVLYEVSDPTHSLESNLSLSRSYTTTAESYIGAPVQEVREYANTSGALPVIFLRDYANEQKAFEAMLEWSDWADETTLGELTIEVGDIRQKWNAGLEGIEINSSFMPSGVRLSLALNFILGNKILA